MIQIVKFIALSAYFLLTLPIFMALLNAQLFPLQDAHFTIDLGLPGLEWGFLRHLEGIDLENGRKRVL
ncbi:MAG: hypothetical protein EA402_02575 [Planctomycetota bacterium]|nr:MAG: hypothetical protein EA402_02575 [Planctomycetota bacterium]